MKPQREINALINALRRLYARIVSLVLDKRMSSYREEAGTEADQDLSTLLADYIDRLADSRPANESKAESQVSVRKVQTTTQTLSLSRHQPDRQASIISRTLGGLAKYFKFTRTRSVPDPELSQKLKKSTWTHIHTAFRIARQGDARTAKLHLDIASQALKQAAHYMSREEHIAFTVKVEEKLGELTGQDVESNI